jgi:toxin ParE1/3/4
LTAVHISAEAEADLDAIWFHVASDSPVNADRFLERLITTLINTLSTMPLAGRTRDEFGIGLRSFPIENYIAFYRATKTAIEIVRIIHRARDLGAIFGD